MVEIKLFFDINQPQALFGIDLKIILMMKSQIKCFVQFWNSQNKQKDFRVVVTFMKFRLRIKSPMAPNPNPAMSLARWGSDESIPAFDNLKFKASVMNIGAAVCRK